MNSTTNSPRARRVLTNLLPAAAAAMVLGATAVPSQAAVPAESRNLEVVNKADGGRLSAWDDNATPNAWAATIRQPNSDYEQRTSTQWALQDQGDGTWVLRNEKNTTVCLQPSAPPAADVRIVLQPCDAGNALQRWKIVREKTDLNRTAGYTGWWTLRPAQNTRLAAAPSTVGGAYSDIRLFRATNSDDRLWHAQQPGRSW
jgi:hypothetical protein